LLRAMAVYTTPMKPASVNLYWTLAVAQAITGILL
jgi:hypothetical protein